MDMQIYFPESGRVDTQFGGFTIETDQPLYVGESGGSPTLFGTLLASIATCTGIYISQFCQDHGLATDAAYLRLQAHTNTASGIVEEVELVIDLPAEFPDEYEQALVKAAENCTAQEYLELPPRINVRTSSRESVLVG